MPEKEHGVVEVDVVSPHPVFAGIPRLRAYESHQWKVGALGAGLRILATSRDGIEAVAHESLPIVGFQFHPEKAVDEAADGRLLANVIAWGAARG